MARYYFNLIDGDHFADTEGTELPGVPHARTEAIKFLAAYVKDRPGLVDDGRHFGVEVTDQEGELLFTTITLSIDRSRRSNAGGSAANDRRFTGLSEKK